MSKFEDFSLGQTVNHGSMGAGVVNSVGAGFIDVDFVNGAHGQYDRGWFETYPDLLTIRTVSRFPTPDADGFFDFDSGEIWVHDGDRYILRAKDGTEKLVEAAVDEHAHFNDPETGESVEDDPPFNLNDFGIKPARPEDRVVLHVSIPGATMANDLAALGRLFPFKAYDNNCRMTPGQRRVLETLRDHGAQRRPRYGAYPWCECYRKGWTASAWIDDTTGKPLSKDEAAARRTVGMHTEDYITEAGRAALAE